MILDTEAIDDCRSMLTREAFYQVDHQIIFDVLGAMRDDEKPTDVTILRDELIRRGLYEEIGGGGYLGQLMNTVPSAAHAKHYAKIVRDRFTLRNLIGVSNQILRDAYAPMIDVKEIVDSSERRIMEACDTSNAAGEVPHMAQAIEDAFASIVEGPQMGTPTGFQELDDILFGLHGGDYIIIAGRPSMGKTAIGTDIAVAVASRNVPVAIFSLEMSKGQISQRVLCARAGVDSQKVRKGLLRPDEVQRMSKTASEVSEFPIFCEDSPSMTIYDIRARARRLKRKEKIGLVVVDYLQLIDSAESGDPSRQQQITAISKGFKSIARELDIPVIVLSQLNRAAESRTENRPRMSDLRESGSIEQDADVIMLMYREDYYGQQQSSDYQPTNIAEAIIAKQRNGPTGTVKLFFDKTATTFRNLAHRAEHPSF